LGKRVAGSPKFIAEAAIFRALADVEKMSPDVVSGAENQLFKAKTSPPDCDNYLLVFRQEMELIDKAMNSRAWCLFLVGKNILHEQV
jgi:hypothetical protein